VYNEAGQVRRHVLIFYNDENVTRLERRDLPLKIGDRVSILQAVSGG
jgi:sulfur-carrier protein